MSDTVRMVEQARELARDGWYHSPGHVRAVLGCLADAVERLQREREEVEFQLRGGWDGDGPATDGLEGLDLTDIANVLHSTAAERYVELHEARDAASYLTTENLRLDARVAELEAGDRCAHDSVDTFASGAGRRVDVCMGCDRVLRHWTDDDARDALPGLGDDAA